MDAHEVTDLLEARRRRGESYLEFLRVASMSCGLYELPRGAEDKQTPHAEDEVYYVVRGRARIRVRSEDREVRPGVSSSFPPTSNIGSPTSSRAWRAPCSSRRPKGPTRVNTARALRIRPPETSG